MEQISVNKTRMIKRNALQCSCGRFAVDGGHDYIQRVFAQGMISKDFIDLTEYEEVSNEEVLQGDNTNA